MESQSKVENYNLKKVTMYDGLTVYVDENLNIYSIHMKLLEQRENNMGYMYISIRKGTRNYNRMVHRIYAQAFLKSDLTDEYEVHHKDKNPKNNSLDNLEVMLRYAHKLEHNQIYPLTKICEVCGTEYTPSPTKRKRSHTCSEKCARILSNRYAAQKRKPIDQYTLDGKLINEWEYGTQIENELGYAISNICKCCKGIIHSAYGYIWRYHET